jgi:hypothetical protein
MIFLLDFEAVQTVLKDETHPLTDYILNYDILNSWLSKRCPLVTGTSMQRGGVKLFILV